MPDGEGRSHQVPGQRAVAAGHLRVAHADAPRWAGDLQVFHERPELLQRCERVRARARSQAITKDVLVVGEVQFM